MTPIPQMTEQELRVAVAEARGLPKIATRWRIEYRYTSGGWQSCADAYRDANGLLQSGWKVSVPESYQVANDPPELDANAAESLCNALAERGWDIQVTRILQGDWSVTFDKIQPPCIPTFTATGPTLSIAIARAYLAVVQSQKASEETGA